MRTVSKQEAIRLFNKISAVDNASASAYGTAQEDCNDPICEQYRSLHNLGGLADNDCLLMDDFENPVYLLPNYHRDKTCRVRGIMLIGADEVKYAYKIEGGLVVEYFDGLVERYTYLRPVDAYFFHSNNRHYFPKSIIHPN